MPCRLSLFGRFVLVSLAVLPSVASALEPNLKEEWPQWRGPYFNGSTDEKDLPSKWSKTENIAWSVGLPGAPKPRGAATPM